MTEEEWLASDDPIAMLEALRDHWQGEEDELVSIIHRYLLACCRVIWALLPMEASRLGVEAAERHIEGRATREEFAYAFGVAVGTDFMRSDFRLEFRTYRGSTDGAKRSGPSRAACLS